MTDKLIEQIKEENEALKEAVCNAYLRGAFEERRKRRPEMEARILADAEVIKAAEELAGCLQYADRRIAWEAHGLGNGFAERAEASLTAFRQAQQARAEKGGE